MVQGINLQPGVTFDWSRLSCPFALCGEYLTKAAFLSLQGAALKSQTLFGSCTSANVFTVISDPQGPACSTFSSFIEGKEGRVFNLGATNRVPEFLCH